VGIGGSGNRIKQWLGFSRACLESEKTTVISLFIKKIYCNLQTGFVTLSQMFLGTFDTYVVVIVLSKLAGNLNSDIFSAKPSKAAS
jgi:hypothetical protein